MGIDKPECESIQPPSVVVCHFPHKIDTQTLKSESSASLFPLFSSTSTLPTRSTITASTRYRPSLATQWSFWRRKAAGPATDEEESQGGSVYASPREEHYDSDCVGGQRSPHHHENQDRRPELSESDDEESGDEVEDQGTTHHKPASKASHTVSSLSSNSQGTASQSARRSSQSGPKPKKRKKDHPNSAPHPPQSPLGDTSHSSRDHRRLKKLSNMVDTRGQKERAAGGGRNGNGRPIGKGGSPSSNSNPKKKGKAKRKRGGDDYEDADDLRAQLAALQARLDATEGDEPTANGRESGPYLPPSDDDDDDDDSVEGVQTFRGFNMGDPADQKCSMWVVCFKTMRETVYREIKFINEEKQKDDLCIAVMDNIGLPELTLTGNHKKDESTLQIWVVAHRFSFCPLQISNRVTLFLDRDHGKSQPFPPGLEETDLPNAQQDP